MRQETDFSTRKLCQSCSTQYMFYVLLKDYKQHFQVNCSLKLKTWDRFLSRNLKKMIVDAKTIQNVSVKMENNQEIRLRLVLWLSFECLIQRHLYESLLTVLFLNGFSSNPKAVTFLLGSTAVKLLFTLVSWPLVS